MTATMLDIVGLKDRLLHLTEADTKIGGLREGNNHPQGMLFMLCT